MVKKVNFVDFHYCPPISPQGTSTANYHAGHTSNSLLIELNYVGPVVEFSVQYRPTTAEEQLCLYDIDCSHADKASWELPRSTLTGTLNLTVQEYYNAEVEYECGRGRGFNVTGWPATEFFPAVIKMWCDDKENWIYKEPSLILDETYVEADMPVCRCRH